MIFNVKMLCALLLVLMLLTHGQAQQTPSTCNTCPTGYYYYNHGCAPLSPTSCPLNYINVDSYCYYRDNALSNPCPQGYQFLNNNACYPQPSCGMSPVPPSMPPPQEPACAPETTPPPPTVTPPPYMPPYETTQPPYVPPYEAPTPPPAQLERCPPGSLYTRGACRKIICSQGELYKGRCLRPICPEGTVWRGRRCQQPNFITTILQIENLFANELREHGVQVQRQNINNLEYHTSPPETLTPQTVAPVPYRAATPSHMLTTTEKRPVPTITATTRSPAAAPRPPVVPTGADCCEVLSPRLCRMYGVKWVCHHRREKRCDSEFCQRPMIIYLRSPEVANAGPVLIMPPNPPLSQCDNSTSCESSNRFDCSGCSLQRRESCSPYCYNVVCPPGMCEFKDLQEYCATNQGQFGCNKIDGCVWEWCDQ